MKRKFLRLCSIVLVMVLIINMLPMHVWATHIGQTGAIGQIDADTEVQNLSVDRDLDLSSTHIVSEITENRTEYTKEFRLDNGLIMASVYNEAIHYEKDGAWEDIDNTLTAQLDEGDTVYTNAAGLWNVRFPQKMTADSRVTITKDGYTLAFGLMGKLTSSNDAVVMSIGENTAEKYAVQSVQSATAQIIQLNSFSAKEEAQFEETVLDKLNSRLSYAGVYENTDVIYDLQSNRVKESIIIEEYDSALRGYRYTLEVGTLVPVLMDDGHIDFYDENRRNIVMVMPAPFMVDDNMEYSHDVTVHLTGDGSTYTLSYLLPTAWMAESDRAFPVILDPVVQPVLETKNIGDCSVFENYTPDRTHGMLDCGVHTNSWGLGRFYLKYNTLPSLTSADVVVGAYIRLYKPQAGAKANAVEVHKVNTEWTSGSFTWSTKPAFSEVVEDYVLAQSAGQYVWDVTDIAREWYATDNNTGMMFKLSNTDEASEIANYKQFYSSDFTENNAFQPSLSIFYRNANGLENYWDYTSASAGRAGTGYINNYTGNLVWTHSDIGFGGNLMPVSISHVYNANDAAKNSFGMGYGWRTNFNQKVYSKTLSGVTYYVWEDADGTSHYFYYDSTDKVYKDEDGLELKMTVKTSGSPMYIIEDKDGNISNFDSNGRLITLINNQKTKSSISISYTTNAGWLISAITDGAGRVYSFTYTNSLLNRISYKGTGSTEISYVTFGYTNANLTSITDKDGESIAYTYGTNHLLASATDVDGYKLSYTYNNTNAGVPNRIASVTETDGTVQGGKLSVTYSHNQTTFTEVLKDGTTGNVQIVQFNNWGNTVSIQDGEGRAQFARWAKDADPTGGKGNQLSLTSKLQNTVGNVVKTSSFESGSEWYPNKSTLSVSRTTEQHYHGSYSLKITNSTAETTVALSQGANIAPGETYTFSAYIKTANAAVTMGLHYGGDYTTYIGPRVNANTDWGRVEMSYTNDTSATRKIIPCIVISTVGSAYMDCVQYEKAPTASRYNLIENGDFRYSGTPAYGWTGTNLGTADGCVSATSAASQLDATVLKIIGSPISQKRVIQTVYVSGNKGDTLILSGWAKGNAAPDDMEGGEPDGTVNDRVFGLVATINYADGSTEKVTATFNPDVENWQYTATPIVPQKAYTSVKVELTYDYNVNTMLFDGIQLYKEEFGSSYTYDDDGNVISVVDLQKKNTTYEYDTNGNLTKVLQDNQAKMTYTYDDYHNVKTATSAEGLVYSFVYDTYGNNTKVSITSDGKTLSSTANYTTDGNCLTSTTDAVGNTTQYGYNADTNILEWVQYPNDTPDSRTEYTYDTMYRLASAQADVGSQTLSASYTYADDLLTKIQTGSTTYSFSYGNFALRSAITIGNRTLASYEYTNDGRNSLNTLVYGNQDMVQYTYDEQGRVTVQTYEDGDTVTYKYDNNGALAKVKDSATGRTTTYYYDFTDRLMKTVEIGSGYSHIVGYEYDDINNLTALVETINGVKRTTSYAYDDDNRVTSVTNGDSSRNYTYDGFSRVSQKTTKHSTSTVLTDAFTFREPSSTTTTGQIATHKITAGSTATTYTYTYDDNGNILSVNDGTYTTSYTYDTANQLTRENNQRANKTWVWTYDNAGNILSRKEYAYTTGSLGTVLDTATYGYNDSAWGDLLTSYDGQTITTDEIGNMLSDGTWTYTWEHGRELVSMSKSEELEDTTITFQYDANGMRTTKTITTNTYHTHSYTATVTAPTCTATGYTTYTCACGDSYQSDQTAATGHTYTATVVAPTCTEIGYTLNTCHCGDSYQTDETEALGHDLETNNTQVGIIHSCTRCDYSYSEHTHSYTTTVKEATCREAGYTLHECDCGYSYQSDAVPALGHDFEGTPDGDTIFYICSRCGASYVEFLSLLPGDDVAVASEEVNQLSDTSAVVTSETEPILVSTVEETHSYVYNGGQLVQEVIVTETTVDGTTTATTKTLNFTYDAAGTPLSLTYNGTTYYYSTNIQGDIVSIVASSGITVVRYFYDAWGNIRTITGAMPNTLGKTNPLRYRGYVYDQETGFYYLQSRYYNPEMGRFINADALASTGQGMLGNNMFAYCNNNPVINFDISGMISRICLSEDTRLNEQPWRDHSPGGGRIISNIVFPSTAQYIFSKTEININGSDPDKTNIHIEFSTEQTEADIFMSSEDLNEYVHLLNKEIINSTGSGLDENNLRQLYGEINLHIFGWDIRNFHFWDERFRVTEIDIVDGHVQDTRWYVNFASWLFGGGYGEE